MFKKLLVFSFLVMICLVILFSIPNIKQYKKEIVVFSVMIEADIDFDYFLSWLKDLNYTHFTFVLWEEAEDNILNNATRVNALKNYGEIIPRRDYLQLSTPQERRNKIDEMVEKYNNSLGYTPKGIMSFIPDTFTVQYLLEKNFSYIQGYCFDQYVIDYMTMRGGWQMPYYANLSHVLVPNSQKSIVVFPHLTWDWIESFRISHHLNTHPLNLKEFFDGDATKAKAYWLSLIDSSLSCSEPFGFAVCQFEWQWLCKEKWENVTKDWICTLVKTQNYAFLNFEETAEWFLTNYSSSPIYKIIFVSPYTGERIEWYYDNRNRIARIGSEIVSYVNYMNQTQDRYLNQIAQMNWGTTPSESNCIDYSLQFEIDALGGGYLRSPIKTATFTYKGDLSSFAKFYP